MIYRITDIAAWRQAEATGVFVSPDLALEGFIHCSERGQVLRTANKYFAGRPDLVLLEIDESRLGSRCLREHSPGADQVFPHVYGPIALTAVVRHLPMTCDADGGFVLPMALTP